MAGALFFGVCGGRIILALSLFAAAPVASRGGGFSLAGRRLWPRLGETRRGLQLSANALNCLRPNCARFAEFVNVFSRFYLSTNLGVGGSNPPRRANLLNGLRKIAVSAAIPCQHYVSAKPGNSDFSALLRRRPFLIEVEEPGEDFVVGQQARAPVIAPSRSDERSPKIANVRV